MKILPIVYSQNSINKNEQIRYSRFESSQDTFTKTSVTGSPSFGNNGSIIKIAQEVINSPDLRQKYAEFTAGAFLALLGIAGGKEFIDKLKDDASGSDGITFKLNIQQDNENSGINQISNDSEQEIKDLKDENERLTKEIAELKQQYAALTGGNPPIESEQSPSTSEDETDKPIQTHKHRCVHVKFPKKNAGKLSEGQRQLKSIAEKLRLNKDECAKLTAICAKSLQKNVYIIDGKKFDNSKLAGNLAKELEENRKEPEAIIAKYYKLFGLEDTENSVQTVEAPSVATEEEQNGNFPATSKSEAAVPETEVQEEESEQTTGAKAKENSTEISKQENVANQNTSSSPKENSSNTAPRIDACHINVTNYEIDPSELHAKGKNVVLIDPKSDVYSYYDYSAFDHDIYTIFQNMQRKFESAVYKNKRDTQRVNWIATRGTVYGVTENAVENGIRSLFGESACEHLTTDDTAEVAYAINADRRFGKYFRLHGAIRLIDRFANFDDPDTPLEEQCHEMLDCFENIVKRAFHNRINIKLYVDENGDFGERIAISPSSYYEEDKKYFKDKPLILGLGKIYTPSKSDRPPIIITIFNDNNQ